jgi:copper chaperone CopZ
MVDWTINVSGLSCNRCAETVAEQLRDVDGITSVSVDEHTGGVSPVTLTAKERVVDAVLQDALSAGGAFEIVSD